MNLHLQKLRQGTLDPFHGNIRCPSGWHIPGGWDDWMETATSAGLPTGEWGVRANITYDGAGVTYNVYQDGAQVASGLNDNSYTVSGLDNNTVYAYMYLKYF